MATSDESNVPEKRPSVRRRTSRRRSSRKRTGSNRSLSFDDSFSDVISACSFVSSESAGPRRLKTHDLKYGKTLIKNSITEYVEVKGSDEYAAKLLQCREQPQPRASFRRTISARSKVGSAVTRQSFSSLEDLTSSEFTIDEVDFATEKPMRRAGEQAFMIKRLCADWYNNDKKAAMRLATEAELLMKMSHTNVVLVKAVVGVRGTGSFGFVTERITSSLGECMVQWKASYKKSKGRLGFGKDINAIETLLAKRFTALFGIASAIRYLHSRQILFRNLCPNSCGYDGQFMKLFDFVHAKQTTPDTFNEEYHHTQMVGKKPYMAREVIVGDGYGSSSDIYSFAIIFWQVMALKKVSKICSGDMDGYLAGSKSLPKLRFLSDPLVTVMTRACSPEPCDRPDIDDICGNLETAILYGK